jgi:hypothetical protein
VPTHISIRGLAALTKFVRHGPCHSSPRRAPRTSTSASKTSQHPCETFALAAVAAAASHGFIVVRGGTLRLYTNRHDADTARATNTQAGTMPKGGDEKTGQKYQNREAFKAHRNIKRAVKDTDKENAMKSRACQGVCRRCVQKVSERGEKEKENALDVSGQFREWK